MGVEGGDRLFLLEFLLVWLDLKDAFLSFAGGYFCGLSRVIFREGCLSFRVDRVSLIFVLLFVGGD